MHKKSIWLSVFFVALIWGCGERPAEKKAQPTRTVTKLPQPVVVEEAPRYGAWKCDEDANKTLTMALFPESDFIGSERSSNEGGDVLFAGNYKLNGGNLTLTILAVKDKKAGWSSAPKAAKLKNSRQLQSIQEYEIIRQPPPIAVLQPVRWVNWDGKDVLDMRQNSQITCNVIKELLPEFEAMRKDISRFLTQKDQTTPSKPVGNAAAKH